MSPRMGIREGSGYRKEHSMGRGDRAKIRWAHDRERQKKERDVRQAKERGAARKAAAKK
jgi:hypothetical protein